MPHARVIVCEKTGRWAVALRREAGPKSRVYETRSLSDCWEELLVSPASWLVLEVTESNVESVQQHLTTLSSDFPDARAMICGDRQMEFAEWLCREAGAVHAVFSPRELAPVARLIARHLAQAPQPPQTLRERIWERLPWQPAAR